jgi:hypothetical protein
MNTAARLAITQVITTPDVVNLSTTGVIVFISLIFRLRPPSKSITATERDTTGSKRSPSNTSGSNIPSTGPAIKPAAIRSNMEGNLVNQAIIEKLCPAK